MTKSGNEKSNSITEPRGFVCRLIYKVSSCAVQVVVAKTLIIIKQN